LTRKIDQTKLVFGVQSGFNSTSVRARLQVSVCSGYDLCHPWSTSRHTDRQTNSISVLNAFMQDIDGDHKGNAFKIRTFNFPTVEMQYV